MQINKGLYSVCYHKYMPFAQEIIKSIRFYFITK